MTRVSRGAIMLALGTLTARLLWSGGFGWFVQQRMKWPLILAAVALLVLGAYEVISALFRQPATALRSSAPSVGWLLILPLLVLVMVAPTGLGAAAADRVDAYTPTESTDVFDPLPNTPAPIEMRVFDFLDRAVWDAEESLDGRVVQLEGLVVNDPAVPDGFRLTRFAVSCCAADGIPLQVTLRNVGTAFSNDDWVRAEVVWIKPDIPYREAAGDLVVEAQARSVSLVTNPPNDPYESPY